MGICYSKVAGKNDRREENEDSWWKSSKDNKIDPKLKKNGSADFGSFIVKLGGGGGVGVVADLDERELLQIPGRMFANGASNIASLHTQQGKKGTNQDAMIVWENYSSRSDTVFCGVFDGHGPYGHMVARKVRDSLPLLLRTQWEANSKIDQNCVVDDKNGNGSAHSDEFLEKDYCDTHEAEETEKLPEMHQPLRWSLLKAFRLMDKELKFNPTIDCFCSGSTAVTLIMQGQDLIMGNVGDSRAVLGTREIDDSLTAVQLTVDLKPNLPREAARIQLCKGRVFALQDEPEVARVWLPNSDSPGLAMARAFGDFCLKDFGLISVPDVFYHRITVRDEFVILATDGVWDVLSNKEAVDIVSTAPGRATAARAVVDCATRAWRLKYPTSKIDDCAVVCLFLDHVSAVHVAQTQKGLINGPLEEVKQIPPPSPSEENSRTLNMDACLSFQTCTLEQLESITTTIDSSSEIEPIVSEERGAPESSSSLGQSKRSLAECLLTSEDEEWSALEGITRVNSLLSLPRFLSADRRSASWRKWL